MGTHWNSSTDKYKQCVYSLMIYPLLLAVLKLSMLLPCPILPCIPWDTPLISLKCILPETDYRDFWNFGCNLGTILLSVKNRNSVFGNFLPFLADRFLMTVKFKLALASTVVPGGFQCCCPAMEAWQFWNHLDQQFHRSVCCAVGVTLVLWFLVLITFAIFFLRRDKWVLQTVLTRENVE